MARNVDAKYSTLIGTAEQIRALVDALASDAAANLDLKFSNFVVLGKDPDADAIRRAMETTPKRQRG